MTSNSSHPRLEITSVFPFYGRKETLETREANWLDRDGLIT